MTKAHLLVVAVHGEVRPVLRGGAELAGDGDVHHEAAGQRHRHQGLRHL